MYRLCISHTRHSDLPLLYSNTDKEKKLYPPPGKMLKVSYYLKKKSNGSKLIYTHKVQLIRVLFFSLSIFFFAWKSTTRLNKYTFSFAINSI